MTTENFPDRARVDALDKVRGITPFAADVPLPELLHAMTVPSGIAKGWIVAVDSEAALRVPGVVQVLTHRDFAGIRSTPAHSGGGAKGPGHQPMTDDVIVHRGQPIALVVAVTLETAIEAAALVKATYATEEFTALMDSPGAQRGPPEPSRNDVGDADTAYAAAPIRADVEYRHPAQHQNPMELISTTASWSDGELTIYEGTQNTGATKFGLAGALGLDPQRVHVKSPYLGGGFGQKNQLQRQTALVAYAALMIGRPIKLVMPRGQLFHMATYRPASTHRLRLGATRDGRFTAAIYETEQQNSRIDQFGTDHNAVASRMYACTDYRGSERKVLTDTQPAGFMRAPHEHPASFAFECAIDELAYAAEIDPVAFRLANDARHDPITGKPFSSRFLAECLTQGAERFGWSRRTPAPGSMVAGDGQQIGWGVAAGAYKAATAPVFAKLRINANGTTRLSVSGHEMGQGIRTAIIAALLAHVEIDPARIELLIGDTDGVPQHLTAGSWGTASAVPVTRLAAERMKASLTELLGHAPVGNVHRLLAGVRRPFVEVSVDRLAPGQPPAALERARTGQPAAAGPDYPDFSAYSYIAHFVEVRVEPTTGRIRVPRVVSICDCGNVVSPRTAASQIRGGVVWGIGAALREASEVDPRYGRVVNNDLADYVLPVNADIGEIDVGFIGRPDPLLNASGVKGAGEVAMVGVSAAIVNAVFHATGKRMRELPIRVEHLL